MDINKDVLIKLYIFLFILCVSYGLQNNKILKICSRNNSTNKCDEIFIYRKSEENYFTARNVAFSVNQGIENIIFGRNVRVVVQNYLPFTFYNSTTKKLDGFLGNLWNILMTNLKFKSNVSVSSYDDGLKIIQKGDADFLLGVGVFKDGLINIDYSQPFFINWYHLYYRQPRAQAQSSSYLRTLDDELWTASVIMFSILSVLIWGTVKVSRKHILDQLEVQAPLFNCFLTTVSGFINQGFDINVQCLSARILVFFALIFGTMLYLSMNAVLVAQLAIFSIDSPFRSLHDLSVKRSHSLCLRNNSFVYNNFTKVYSETNKTILQQWNKILNGPGCLDINDQNNIPKIICNERIVVLENRAVMSAVMTKFKLPCTITHRPERLFTRSNHFLILKSFKGKKVIKYFLKQLKSTGVNARLENEWVPDKITGNSDGVIIPQVTMEHISGIILVLVIFIPVAFLVLIIEGVYYRSTITFDFVK